MATYHVNPETMRPNICRAASRESCLYYDRETLESAPHFGTKEGAREYITQLLSRNNETTSTIVAEAARVFTIPESSLAELEQSVAAKNRKLERAGVKERFVLEVSEPSFKLVKRDGKDVLVSAVNVSVNKPVIRAGGWSFEGALSQEEAGLIYKGFQNSDYKAESFICEHCGVSRHRKNTYVLKNDSGEYKQVGGSCLRAFLGESAPPIHVLEDDIDSFVEELSARKPPLSSVALKVDDVLRTSLVLSSFGEAYKSKDKAAWAGVDSTGDEVADYFYNEEFFYRSRSVGDFESKRDSKEVDDALKTLKKSVLENKPTNEYEENLQTLFKGEYVSKNSLRLLASSVVKLREKQEREEWAKGFVGEVGKKIEKQKVTVVKRRTREAQGYSYYSPTVLKDTVILRTEEGRMITFFANRIVRVKPGTVIELAGGTVKSHKTFKGIDQTIIQRARLEEIPEDEWDG